MLVGDIRNWPAFIKQVAGDDTNTRIAQRSGVHVSTVGRWRTGATVPDADVVIRFATGYNANPFDALVAAGIVSPEWVGLERVQPKSRVEDITSVDLAQELLRRVTEQEQAMQRPRLVAVSGPTDDELRQVSLDEMPAAAGDDETTDDEDVSTP